LNNLICTGVSLSPISLGYIAGFHKSLPWRLIEVFSVDEFIRNNEELARYRAEVEELLEKLQLETSVLKLVNKR